MFLFSSASASFAFHFFDFVREFFPFFVCIYPNVRTVTGLMVLGPPMSEEKKVRYRAIYERAG
jgi:hypothetical protein